MCTPLFWCPGSALSSGSWAAPPGGRGTCGKAPPRSLCWLLAGQESTAPPGGKSEISFALHMHHLRALLGVYTTNLSLGQWWWVLQHVHDDGKKLIHPLPHLQATHLVGGTNQGRFQSQCVEPAATVSVKLRNLASPEPTRRWWQAR